MADYNTNNYRISDIYQGGYSSMKRQGLWSDEGRNYIATGSIGTTTDPRTANVLKEVSDKLSSGIKNIEVTSVSPEIFDSIPKQQLKEIHRLTKLTGIDVSMHAPVIDSAGMSQQGFSESERELAVRKITNALIRARELNPDGNIPVTFHSAEGIPASQPLPPGKRKEAGSDYQKLIAVNRETGRLIPLETEIEYRPGGEEALKVVRSPESRVESLNNTEWKNSMFQIEVNRENAERIMQDIHPISIAQFAKIQARELDPSELAGEEIAQIKKVSSAFEFIEQAKLSADSLFSKAYEIAKADNNGEQINRLNEISKKYGEAVGIEGGEIKNPERYLNPKAYSEALYEFTRVLERLPPEMYVSVEKFATDKSSQTYGQSAYNAYKEFKGKNVPILVIENPPANIGLSTGEDIANLVKKSREKFVEAAKAGGMDEKDAAKEAEKLIGATWDVGHINMLRRYGYTEDDIVEETRKVAPFVKHVHLSDNFGLEHTELPMGMGNVPLKEMMEKLGQKGFEAKKIIEASAWWQHWRTNPFQESLEGLGSPIYGMKMAPYWDQTTGLYQGYFSGMQGSWLPQVNYEMFGSGFSKLPSELGGQSPGAQGSRMSGRGME